MDDFTVLLSLGLRFMALSGPARAILSTIPVFDAIPAFMLLLWSPESHDYDRWSLSTESDKLR